MTSPRRYDSVGWIFWLVLSALLAGPVTYFVYYSLYDTITIGQRIGTGIIVSFVLGAVATTCVNEILQRAARRRAEKEKEVARGEAKRKKRRKKQ